MYNYGAFLLDPLNLTGIQNMGSTQGAPSPRPQADPNASGLHNTGATAQPGMTYPGLQPDLNLGLQPPPGMGPSGDANGRTTKGFLQSMLGADGNLGPGRAMAPGWQPPPPPPSQWTYQQGKGPVWQSYEKGRTQSEYKPVFNAPFSGNRF